MDDSEHDPGAHFGFCWRMAESGDPEGDPDERTAVLISGACQPCEDWYETLEEI